MTDKNNGETSEEVADAPAAESTDEATEEATDATEAEAAEEAAEAADDGGAAEDAADEGGDDEGVDDDQGDETAADAHSKVTPVNLTPVEQKSVQSAHIHTNTQTIEAIFTGTGDETEPGDPHGHALWDASLEGPPKNETSAKVLALTVLAIVVLLGIGFAVLPANLKEDAINLLQGKDIIEMRELREQARVEEERRQMLEAAPKFGTVEIVTNPNNLLVTSPDQPAMIFPGTRTDLTYPTRTRVTFQDISVTEDFSFTIHGEGNFQDKTFVIPAFGQIESPWAQSYSGDYTASLTFMVCWPGQQAPVEEKFCLYPQTDVPWRARELQWRMAWRPDPAETDPEAIIRLPGAITVTSTPANAIIAFNGRQLVDEATIDPATGQPTAYTTPYTFSTYNAPADHEDRTPLDVYLSREGLPLQLLYEGKASAVVGVYLHQFLCNLKEGATVPDPVPTDAPEGTPPETWLGLCDYTYSVDLALVDPKPPEASGEGSGEGSGTAPAQPAGE